MTRQEFYTLVATWISTVMPSAVIFRTAQDAQAPARGKYIAIDDSYTWDRFGKVTVGAVENDERQLKHDYEVVVGLWEIRGDGEDLQTLVESLDTMLVKAIFNDAGVGILRETPVTKMTDTLDSARNVRRFRTEITFAISRIVTEDVTYIETVEFIPQIVHES